MQISIAVPSGLESPEQPTEYEQAVKAQVPLQDSPNKQEYLSNRACGFTIREAAAMAMVRQATVAKWRREDPEFAQWESEGLELLQSRLGDKILHLQFMRCMRMSMAIDFRNLFKNFYAPTKLSEFQKLQVLAAQRRYDPKGLLALNRALGEDVSGDGPLLPGETRTKLTLEVEGSEIDTEAARHAAHRQLMKQYDQTAKFLPEQASDQALIEGEAEEIE